MIEKCKEEKLNIIKRGKDNVKKRKKEVGKGECKERQKININQSSLHGITS
jgi:hypothetical protein